MLSIKVNLGEEAYDEESKTFSFTGGSFKLDLEHSLVSLSKWESKYEKPFLGSSEKSTEELIDYVRMMAISPDVSEEVFMSMSQENFDSVNAYLQTKQTATWFREDDTAPKNQRTMTSELLYYMMFSHQIDISCENWYLNRLITLIRVFNEENAPKKKRAPADMARERHQINERRLAEAEARARQAREGGAA